MHMNSLFDANIKKMLKKELRRVLEVSEQAANKKKKDCCSYSFIPENTDGTICVKTTLGVIIFLFEQHCGAYLAIILAIIWCHPGKGLSTGVLCSRFLDIMLWSSSTCHPNIDKRFMLKLEV